jgi:ABC-2 type transport system ATP-binding protein
VPVTRDDSNRRQWHMNENVIELDRLCKQYRSRSGPINAIDGLSLTVPAGGVFGFLGPNGSGKTTTIRCLLGLVRATSGTARLMGAAVPSELPSALRSVGAIVEGPALFPTLSGRENLLQLAAIDRIGAARVDAVLDEVGLAPRARQSVRKYSLGMRQRLALAAALLKDPPLLILDEPANGLDPAGIRQVRELLRRLGAEGRSVFVSSHQLAEVQQVCDRVAILRRGRCVAEGPVADVVAQSQGPTASLVRVEDLDGASAALRTLGYDVTRLPDALRVQGEASVVEPLSQVLGERGHWVTELRSEEKSLEDLFLELTGDPIGVERVLEESR